VNGERQGEREWWEGDRRERDDGEERGFTRRHHIVWQVVERVSVDALDGFGRWQMSSSAC